VIRLRITPQATVDIDDACAWTAMHLSPARSARLAIQLNDAMQGLRVFPEKGRPGRVKDTRELVLGRVPFLIIYRFEAREVIILSVQHQSRMWPPG
jgi:toxin ParE1/3/4